MSSRPHCVHAVSLFLVASLLAACPSRELAKVPIGAEVVEKTNLPLDDNRDVDILFVIDNSDSMLLEQESLAENFPRIIDALRASAFEPSVHFGVISTDVRVGGDFCQGQGDEGALQTGDPACNAINDGSKFLFDIANEDGSRSTNYDGDLSQAFSCMADLGVGGCGFEQPLEALKRAIDNPDNASFFREDAYLAVVFVTDEDDCSLSGPGLLENDGDFSMNALTSPLGPADSFRCFEFGLECESSGGVRDPGARENCIPRSDSPYLADVADYIEHVRGSKRFPSQIFVAGIAGDLAPVAVELRTSNIFTEFPIPQLAYSCEETGLGQAVPPIRLQAFLNAFEGASELASICGDDLDQAVQDIADFLDESFVGPPCITGELADASDEPGLQPDCSIVEVIDPGIESEVQTVLDACDNSADPQSSSNIPCFHMFNDAANCSAHPSQLAVEIIYPVGEIAPPFSRAEVSCVGVAPI